jgi:hypothetical protein
VTKFVGTKVITKTARKVKTRTIVFTSTPGAARRLLERNTEAIGEPSEEVLEDGDVASLEGRDGWARLFARNLCPVCPTDMGKTNGGSGGYCCEYFGSRLRRSLSCLHVADFDPDPDPNPVPTRTILGSPIERYGRGPIGQTGVPALELDLAFSAVAYAVRRVITKIVKATRRKTVTRFRTTTLRKTITASARKSIVISGFLYSGSSSPPKPIANEGIALATGDTLARALNILVRNITSSTGFFVLSTNRKP